MHFEITSLPKMPTTRHYDNHNANRHNMEPGISVYNAYNENVCPVIENRDVFAMGGVGEWDWEFGMSRYKLLYRLDK